MRKTKIALIALAGVGSGWLFYEALTRNPLWFTQFKPVPMSVPEHMVQEARAKGWL